MSKRIISLILSLLLVTSIGITSSFSAAVNDEDDSSLSLQSLRSDSALASVGDSDFNPIPRTSGTISFFRRISCLLRSI